MPANYIETPATERGDASIAYAGNLDFSVVQPFASPSKNPAEDLRNRMRGMRAGGQQQAPFRTPRVRNPLVDRKNNNGPTKQEFTPLLKSAKRNELVRRSLLEEKENEMSDGVPDTPAGFRSSYGGDATQLPINSSMFESELTGGSANGRDATPVVPVSSSSMVDSTPMPELPKRGEGGVLEQGNILTLRDQEAKLDQIQKDNFGLKLKIHFLEEALRKTGTEFQQATLRENAELKTDKMMIDADLKQQRKRLLVAERELEEYRRKYLEYSQGIKKRHAEERDAEELTRLQTIVQESRQAVDARQKEIEDMRLRLEEAQQSSAQQEDAQALKDNIEDLEREIRDRDNELDAKDDEIERLQDQLKERKPDSDQLEHMQQDLDEMEADLKEKDEEIDAKNAKIAELEERTNNAYDREKSTKKLRSEVSALEAAVRAKTEALDDANEEFRNLERKLQTVLEASEAEKQRRDRDVHDLQAKLDAIDSDQGSILRQREESLRNAQRELADKDGEIDALQERLQTARGSWDAEAQQTDARLQEKDRVIREKEAQLRHKSSTIEQRDEELDDLQRRLRAAENRQQDANQKQIDRIKALGEQVDQLEEKARVSEASWKAKLREKDGLIKAREEEIERFQSRLGSIQTSGGAEARLKSEKIEELENQSKRLESKTHEQAQRINSLEMQLEAIETPTKKDTLIKQQAEQTRSLQQKLQKLEQEKDVEIDGLEQELDRLEKENQSLRHKAERIDELDSQIDTVSSQKAELQRKLDRLTEHARAAEKDHSMLGHQNEKLVDKQSQIETLEDQIDQLQTRAQRAQDERRNEIHKLRMDMEVESATVRQALEDELAVLESSLDDAEIEKNALRNQVEDLEQNVQNLQRAKEPRSPPKKENELRHNLQEAHVKASRLQDHVDSLENELRFAREERTLAEERQDLHELLKKAKIESEEVQLRLAERDRKLSASSRREGELRGQLEAAQLESEDLQAEIAGLEATVRAHASREKELRAQLKEFREARIRLEEMETQLGDRNSSSSGHARREAELRTQLRDAKIGLESLQIELAEKEDRILALMKKEHALREKLKTRTGSQNTVELHFEDLQAQLDEVQLEGQTMQHQLQQRDKALATSHKKEGELKAIIRNLQQAIENEETLDQKQTAGKLEASQKRHQRELRGLAKQIQFLRARCEREEGFRKDLVYTKRWFLMQVEMYNQCNEADLRLLEEMGITPDQSFRKRKPSLRSVGLVVIATVRMQKMSASWSDSRKVQESLVKKLDGMRKVKARANSGR